METLAAVNVDFQGQDCLSKALQNHLVVEEICSYLSWEDLINVRSVNRLFHAKATRQMRLSLTLVILKDDSSMKKFLDLMQTRLNPDQLISVPFTAYQLHLSDLSNRTLQRFAVEIGQHVQRLYFGPGYYFTGGRDRIEWKLVLILNHTPNLVKIELVTCSPVRIQNSHLEYFPASYPNLRAINLDYKSSAPFHQSKLDVHNSVSLMDLLIDRAPNLNQLGYVRSVRILGTPSTPETENPGLLTLRGLSAPKVTPVKIAEVQIRQHTLPVLHELQKMFLCIKGMNASLRAWNARNMTQPKEHEAQNLVSNFCNWLGRLSPNLRTLSLDLYVPMLQEQANLDFPFPPLVELTDLIFNVWTPEVENVDRDPWATFFVPLTTNQFPVLESLWLMDTRGARVTFQECPQPSVQKLYIYSLGILEYNAWHRILPNLTTVQFTQSWTKDAEQNLSYILRHFPRLTRLELDLRAANIEDPDNIYDYWDILTGNALRPLSICALFQELKDIELPEPSQEPVDGVYHTPSLGNFPSLKTFQCRPGRRSNLDAILYMSRIGHLGPLKQITIQAVVEDLRLKAEEKAVYRDLLAKAHMDICITDEMNCLEHTSTCNFPYLDNLLEDMGNEDDEEVDNLDEDDDDEFDEWGDAVN